MATHEAQPKTDQADQSDPSDDTPQAADQFDQSDDDAMKGSSRHRSSRIDQQPSPKQKAHEEQQQPSEAQAKPLNHNDLVKWIVVSDAPDYASVVAEFSNAKGYPVLPRSPKYLEKFGARELRIGLKCLRKMNDAAREENGKLEAEAQALGCADGEASSAMELEQQHVEEGPNTPKAIEDADRSMQLDVESKNSLIAILHFNLSFYRSKVLPFIQACLIAEGRLHSLPASTPVALPFPGGVYNTFASAQQRSAAKAAYDIAYAGALPQEACDAAARRRLDLIKNSDDDAAVNLATSLEMPTNDSINANTTPRAPDVSSSASPVVVSAALDVMDLDEDDGADADVAHINTTAAASKHLDNRAETPVTTPRAAADTASTTDTSTPKPNSAAALSTTRTLPPASTPMPSLRRSVRSSTSKVADEAQPTPLKRLSVWEMQREILRLCAQRERCVARNEVLREWLRGARG